MRGQLIYARQTDLETVKQDDPLPAYKGERMGEREERRGGERLLWRELQYTCITPIAYSQCKGGNKETVAFSSTQPSEKGIKKTIQTACGGT